MSQAGFCSTEMFDQLLRRRTKEVDPRREIARIWTETFFDLLPAATVATGSEKQLLLSGTGTEVVTRAPRGGCRITTQATTPADNDQVQLAGVANTNLGLASSAANGPFRIDGLGKIVVRGILSLPSIASHFAAFGLDENITDVDPSGTAGDGVRFVFAPDNATTELAVSPALSSTGLYANWMVHQKIAGADVYFPTNVPVVADRNYDLRIEIDENRKPAFFIDGNLVVGPSQFSAMTADSQMAVMAGVEVTATAAAQKSMDLRYVGAGRLFATS